MATLTTFIQRQKAIVERSEKVEKFQKQFPAQAEWAPYVYGQATCNDEFRSQINDRFCSPLLPSIRSLNFDLVKFLIHHNADHEIYGKSAIVAAVETRNLDMVQLIAANYKYQRDYLDNSFNGNVRGHCYEAIGEAMYNGDYNIMVYLLQLTAIRLDDGKYADFINSTEILQYVIRDIIKRHPENHRKALHLYLISAIRCGDLALLQEIAKGIDFTKVNLYNENLVLHAFEMQHWHIVEYLLSHNIHVSPAELESIVAWCVKNNNMLALNLIYSYDAAYPIPMLPDSIVYIAVKAGNYVMVRFIVDREFTKIMAKNISYRESYDKDNLPYAEEIELAVSMSRQEMVEYLYAVGCKITPNPIYHKALKQAIRMDNLASFIALSANIDPKCYVSDMCLYGSSKILEYNLYHKLDIQQCKADLIRESRNHLHLIDVLIRRGVPIQEIASEQGGLDWQRRILAVAEQQQPLYTGQA